MSAVMQETPKTTKAATEYEKVLMDDGRTVEFAGKRQIQKEVLIDAKTGEVTVRFDFRNGNTLSISSKDLSEETQLRAMGHGLSQKCGDEAAGEKKIEDIVPAVEDMMNRLKAGEWRATREAGDSFAGTSVVIRAIAEITKKTVEDVKAFLQAKLETAKAKGEKLSRQELYATFRRPGSPTASVIARLEAEDAAGKPAKVSATDLLGELATF